MGRIITLFSLLFCSFSYAQVTKVIVWESLYNNPTPILMDSLHRALELTVPEYGDYEIIVSSKMEQGRSLLEIANHKKSKLDITSLAPTIESEKVAIPIRIPVLSGLMGYRLCLIKENHQQRFDNIKNKQQLIEKKITIGQHKDWPDTTILRANGITAHTTHKKNLLFQQLSRERFDCFSRGTSEIYAEYLQYQNKGLRIEKELILYYPLPVFFFVNKSRPLLAERVQLGLERLIASGEMDDIVQRTFLPIISVLKLTERTVIDLHNPTLSDATLKAIESPIQRFRENHLTNKAVASKAEEDNNEKIIKPIAVTTP